MSWRTHAAEDDHGVLRVGSTHRLFPSVARKLLMNGTITVISSRFAHEDAQVLRAQIQNFHRGALASSAKYREMIHYIDGKISNEIDYVDDVMAHHRIRRAEDWMDKAANTILQSAIDNFRHFFPKSGR